MDITAEDQYEEKLHPFTVDVILKTLFKYLDFKDLSTCRLVNKQWFKVSLSQWLNLNNIGLFVSPTSEDGDDTRSLRHDILAFLQMSHNDIHEYGEYEYCGLRQHRTYSLFDWDLQRELPILWLLHQKCGEWITCLVINFTFPNLETYEAIMLSKFTANLKRLAVYIRFNKQDGNWSPKDISNNLGIHKLESLGIFSWKDYDYFLPEETWLVIFRRYAKLLSLEYEVKNDKSNIKLNQMIECACKVRRDGTGLQSLKRLDLFNFVGDICEVTSCQLKFLRDTSARLKALGIWMDIQTQSDIWDLLLLQANSLQKLTLNNRGRLFNHFTIPRMPYVHTVEIWGYPFTNIQFLRGFENLQALIMNDVSGDFVGSQDFCRDIDAGETGNAMAFHSLTKFHFYQNLHEGEKPFGTPVIRRIQKCMPNVKDLQMFLSNDTFREVCKGWSKLEHLEIIGNLVDDEGITGLLESGEIVEPNITCLKELMSFKYSDYVGFVEDNQRPHFTQASIMHGLLLLPNLQSVETSFSDEIHATLAKEIKEREILYTTVDDNND